MATKPREGGGELFYLNEDGNKQDAELHEEILREGNDAPGKSHLGRDQGPHPPPGVAEYAAPFEFDPLAAPPLPSRRSPSCAQIHHAGLSRNPLRQGPQTNAGLGVPPRPACVRSLDGDVTRRSPASWPRSSMAGRAG
jgi:hypothetical protein